MWGVTLLVCSPWIYPSPCLIFVPQIHPLYAARGCAGMRTNQNLIRSTLCDNPALQKLVTLYAVGLGSAPTTCYIYSGDNNLGAHALRWENIGRGLLTAIHVTAVNQGVQ